jgi:hypothetical protein
MSTNPAEPPFTRSIVLTDLGKNTLFSIRDLVRKAP